MAFCSRCHGQIYTRCMRRMGCMGDVIRRMRCMGDVIRDCPTSKVINRPLHCWWLQKKIQTMTQHSQSSYHRKFAIQKCHWWYCIICITYVTRFWVTIHTKYTVCVCSVCGLNVPHGHSTIFNSLFVCQCLAWGALHALCFNISTFLTLAFTCPVPTKKSFFPNRESGYTEIISIWIPFSWKQG